MLGVLMRRRMGYVPFVDFSDFARILSFSHINVR